MAKKDEQKLFCSFCGKPEDQARLIAGPDVCICSDCVQACCDLLQQDTQNKELPDHLPTPMEMKTYMDSYIIGQEDAKIALSVAVYNHYKRILYRKEKQDAEKKNATLDEAPIDLQKSNVLLIGPTGVGKTYLAQTLAKSLRFPLPVRMLRR